MEQKIWNYLMTKIKNPFGVAGLMGNLQAESGLIPTNLQNSFEKSLKLNDAEYTKRVDNGTYGNFAKDKAGYGLAQWTWWSRKEALLKFAKSKKKSIGDLEMQLDFLLLELTTTYKGVYTKLQKAKSVQEASDCVLLDFEKPAKQDATVKAKRASYGQIIYNKFAVSKPTEKNNGGNKMSNSKLVNCTVLSPNHSGKRTHAIDRITPHCVCGQLSAESIGGCFPKGRNASCNYGIGFDGRVCLIVDEANRTWCSSSAENDQRAITIEVASDTKEPYAFKDAAYNKLIDLCVDICKRNGKNTLLWIENKDKALAYRPKDNEMLLTVHRWFANKSCPGNWMFARMGDLARKVTAKLGGKASNEDKTIPLPEDGKGLLPSFKAFTVKVTADALNVRKGPNVKFDVIRTIRNHGTFTIVDKKGNWGKILDDGWICLDYTKKI